MGAAINNLTEPVADFLGWWCDEQVSPRIRNALMPGWLSAVS